MEEIAEKDPRLGVCCIHYFISTSDTTKDELLVKVIDMCCANKETLLLIGSKLCEYIESTESKSACLSSLIKRWSPSFLLISSYLSVLSSARKTPSQSVIKAGGVLASQSTHELLSKDLFPSLSRGVKRNPEMAVPCMVEVVTMLAVDGSRYLPYLVDSCMYFFKQNTPEASKSVHSLLNRLLNHCSDGEAITSFMNSLLHEMDAARLTPVLKKQVYLGLQAVIQGMNERVMGKASYHASTVKIGELLFAVLKKESNPAAKGCLLDCISHAVLLSETYSEDLLVSLSGSLQATSTTLLPSLYCLSAVLRVATTIPKPEPLKKGLETLKHVLLSKENVINC